MTSRDDIMVEINPQTLLKAYACGIFPMAEDASDTTLYWIEPENRGVIPLDGVHVPKRLARTIRQKTVDIRINTDFGAVIDGCASERAGRSSTWINDRIRELYGELFKMGRCHTVEVWRKNKLVGGLYGVHMGGAFFGESMFSYERDASKVALIYLVARLNHGGFSLLDTQFVTTHLMRFGAVEIPRNDYQVLLDKALKLKGDFHRLPADTPPDGILQLVSQTSSTGSSTA